MSGPGVLTADVQLYAVIINFVKSAQGGDLGKEVKEAIMANFPTKEQKKLVVKAALEFYADHEIEEDADFLADHFTVIP